MDTTVGFALLLSTLAGLSTTLGSLLAILVGQPSPRFMALTLGLSGGVMVHVAFVELLQDGIDTLGFAPAHLAFFGGMGAMFLVDILVPHDYMAERHRTAKGTRNSQLLKTGLFVALGLGIHNFPEGMASFAGALEDRSLGIAIALAVALHNIPEGLAVSAPIFAATGSRRQAFLLSFLSGLAEPIGAVLAAIVLLPFLNETVLSLVLVVVAGIMVFISLDELLPASCSLGEEHLSIVGVAVGMAVMAFSLWLLQ
jgi:ZIP family zinc transporter